MHSIQYPQTDQYCCDIRGFYKADSIQKIQYLILANTTSTIFLQDFHNNKRKGRWDILLENALIRLAEIYFSQEDADTFNNKMNQSFAAAVLL